VVPKSVVSTSVNTVVPKSVVSTSVNTVVPKSAITDFKFYELPNPYKNTNQVRNSMIQSVTSNNALYKFHVLPNPYKVQKV
jgi:hypothetical protein